MKKTIGLLSAIALSSTAYADVNVGGFVDAGYSWTKDATPSSSWGVSDAAVEFSGNSGSSSYLLDIGFDSGSVNSTVDQAKVSNKYDSGFGWSIGKFDTIIGTQGNDTNTWAFSQSNHISSVLLSSHTGALLSYDLSDMLGLHVLIANGNSTNDGFSYPELGFRLDSKTDGMSFSVGGVFESNNGESGYVFDLGATAAMAGLDLGVELALEKQAVANADSGMIVSVHANKEVSESIGFGARFEWDNGKTSADNPDAGEAAMFFDVGPSFVLSENASAYIDYGLNKYKNSSTHTVGVAVVHNF